MSESKRTKGDEKPSDIAERNVKKLFPDAIVGRDGAFFFVTTKMRGIENRDLGAGFSREGAWCSAGCYIKTLN